MPGVGFGRGQAGAVDARLLAGAVADDLAVHDQAHRVGLGVLQADQRQQHVAAGVVGDLAPAGDDVFEQAVSRDDRVALLLEGEPEDLARLGSGGSYAGSICSTV